MASAAPLSTIIALARTGALDHAWEQFVTGAYDHDDRNWAGRIGGRK